MLQEGTRCRCGAKPGPDAFNAAVILLVLPEANMEKQSLHVLQRSPVRRAVCAEQQLAVAKMHESLWREAVRL